MKYIDVAIEKIVKQVEKGEKYLSDEKLNVPLYDLKTSEEMQTQQIIKSLMYDEIKEIILLFGGSELLSLNEKEKELKKIIEDKKIRMSLDKVLKNSDL